MTLYGGREGAVRPVLQIAMPRLPRLYAPSGTMHDGAPFFAENERLSPPFSQTHPRVPAAGLLGSLNARIARISRRGRFWARSNVI